MVIVLLGDMRNKIWWTYFYCRIYDANLIQFLLTSAIFGSMFSRKDNNTIHHHWTEYETQDASIYNNDSARWTFPLMLTVCKVFCFLFFWGRPTLPSQLSPLTSIYWSSPITERSFSSSVIRFYSILPQYICNCPHLLNKVFVREKNHCLRWEFSQWTIQ